MPGTEWQAVQPYCVMSCLPLAGSPEEEGFDSCRLQAAPRSTRVTITIRFKRFPFGESVMPTIPRAFEILESDSRDQRQEIRDKRSETRDQRQGFRDKGEEIKPKTRGIRDKGSESRESLISCL